MFTKLSIGWSEGTTPISLIIEELDGGKYSHVYLKFESNDKPTLIYESHLKGGVQITPYVQLEAAIIDGKVKSVCELPLSEDSDTITRIWDEACTLHGDAYDKRQILVYFIWIKYFKRKATRVINAFNNGKYTCNEFVITACRAALKDFLNLDFSYTPEGLFKYLYGHSSK